jgi:hypothetical protein
MLNKRFTDLANRDKTNTFLVTSSITLCSIVVSLTSTVLLISAFPKSSPCQGHQKSAQMHRFATCQKSKQKQTAPKKK